MLSEDYFEWTIRIPKLRKILEKVKTWSPLWVPIFIIFFGAFTTFRVKQVSRFGDYVSGVCFGALSIISAWGAWALTKPKREK